MYKNIVFDFGGVMVDFDTKTRLPDSNYIIGMMEAMKDGLFCLSFIKSFAVSLMKR